MPERTSSQVKQRPHGRHHLRGDAPLNMIGSDNANVNDVLRHDVMIKYSRLSKIISDDDCNAPPQSLEVLFQAASPPSRVV